jgi:hypothetical protein
MVRGSGFIIKRKNLAAQPKPDHYLKIVTESGVAPYDPVPRDMTNPHQVILGAQSVRLGFTLARGFTDADQEIPYGAGLHR